MDKFIPYEKLSKAKRREIDRQKRVLWGVSPVTRRPENSKAYNRSRVRDRDREPESLPCFYF